MGPAERESEMLVGCVVLLVVLVLIGSLVIGRVRVSKGFAERRARFVDRAALPAQEWFTRFCSVRPDQRAALEELLAALGKDIGVEWTKLRPDDTFDGTLCTPPEWSIAEFDFDHIEFCLEDWCKRHGVDLVDGEPLPKRLDDFLGKMAAAVGEGERAGAGSS